MRDLRYACRLIRRQPLFAALVIATLALGIGASTSMFSVVNGVLLKPLPYRDPAGLVWMYGSFRGSASAAVSPPDIIDYRNRNDVFERLGAMAISPEGVTVSGSGAPVRMRASRVSAEFISTLGIVPVLGRDFSRADEATGSDAIVVSHRVWQRIRRMVFRQGLALIGCGIPAGIGLSLFTSRFASALLLNVQGSDPMVLTGVAALLTVTSLAAMLAPAQRAAGVKPIAALRAD